MQHYELAIIGGGIVGLATGLQLSERLGRRLLVLEAEHEIAQHQSGHNSGVIHSGLYYKPDSLKATLCTAGRESMYKFCKLHDIPHQRCGKIVVAVDEGELPRLESLHERGVANGLAGIERLGPSDIRRHEPHAAGVAGLYVPQTGIVNYRCVAAKYAELIRAAHGEIRTDCRLRRVELLPSETVLHTTGGPFRCRALINCAGLQSDRVARMCGLTPTVQIVPFRGEYYELTADAERLVRNLIYPVPDPAFPFLGVHFTRMVDGGVEAGPNAVLATSRRGYSFTDFSLGDMAEMALNPGLWRLARRHWATGLGEWRRSISTRAFVRALQRLLPDLRAEHVKRAGAGVRAQAMTRDGRLVDDFVIERGVRMIHVLNAPSPAATASLAIGDSIAKQAVEQFGL